VIDRLLCYRYVPHRESMNEFYLQKEMNLNVECLDKEASYEWLLNQIRQKLENEDCSELFTLAMQSIAVEMADTISNALEIEKYNSMLDLGGGPATYSIAFARKNEKLKVTLLDIPQVIKIAKKIVDKNKLTERFTFIEGDFFEVECGKGYDLIYISNIIHQYSPDENMTF